MRTVLFKTSEDIKSEYIELLMKEVNSLNKEISYSVAALGGVVEVPTLDGVVQLRIRPGTESGTTVRLRGQGIVYPQTARKGDQYVIYKIKVPNHLTSKARRLLEELEKELKTST